MDAVAIPRGAGIGDDVFPFAGIAPSNNRDDRFTVTEIIDLMRYTRLDVDKITGLVVDRLFKSLAIDVTDFALHDVKHQFETVVDMSVRDGTRRDGGHIHGQFGSARVLGAESGFVLDAVPTPKVLSTKHLAGANRRDAVAPVDELPEIDFL